MAREQSVETSMWTADEEFVDLSAPAKVLALWSITSPQTNWAGVFPVSKRAMTNETGLSSAELDASLAELERFGFAFYEDGVLWIRTRARRIAKRGRNMVKAVINDLEVIADGHPIRDRFIAYYRDNRDLVHALPTPSGPPSDGVGTQSQGGSVENGSTKGNPETPSGPPPEGSYVNESDSERTTEVIDQVLATLATCSRWTVNDIDDRQLVERIVFATPSADHPAAALAAVEMGTKPDWRSKPGKTFDYAVRQQLEYAAPKSEPEPKNDRSKYDRGLESRGTAA